MSHIKLNHSSSSSLSLDHSNCLSFGPAVTEVDVLPHTFNISIVLYLLVYISTATYKVIGYE